MSWKPTPKEGGLLAKVLQKHEHSNYVDPLASISMGHIVKDLEDIFGTHFMLHAL